ncbi:MAG: hypothetical protein IV100_26515 [Myxococcales bacterium]|nr:hypothetical protein [Myxococcales bacterium]
MAHAFSSGFGPRAALVRTGALLVLALWALIAIQARTSSAADFATAERDVLVAYFRDLAFRDPPPPAPVLIAEAPSVTDCLLLVPPPPPAPACPSMLLAVPEPLPGPACPVVRCPARPRPPSGTRRPPDEEAPVRLTFRPQGNPDVIYRTASED